MARAFLSAGTLVALAGTIAAQDEELLLPPVGEAAANEGPGVPDAPDAPGAPAAPPAADAPGAPLEDFPAGTLEALTGGPAEQVAELLEARIAQKTESRDAIAVDLGVLTELGSVEAQLSAARLEAERQRLDRSIAELKAAREVALAASQDLEACADPNAAGETYTVLKAAADRARKSVAQYRSDRRQKIAVVEARAPAPVPGAPIAGQVEDYLLASIEAMDPDRRANFLALNYAVATELGVRIPQSLAGGEVVLNDYSTLLHRHPRVEAQMALLTLVAYRNRQGQGIGGTILGGSVEDLSLGGAVTGARGRTYQITEAGKAGRLLEPLRAVWGTPDIVIGTWDLEKGDRTAEAMAAFAHGDAQAPDAGLLTLLTEVNEMIGSQQREDALAVEMDRLHRAALERAMKHDLGMEGRANAVFQADALEKNREKHRAAIVAARAFYREEAGRLADPTAEPRLAEAQRRARDLHEAAISLRRATTIAHGLTEP